MGPLLRYFYLFIVIPIGILSLMTGITIQWTIIKLNLYGKTLRICLLLVTTLIQSRGIIQIFMSIYPFHLAYDDLTSWNIRKNRHFYYVEFSGYCAALGLAALAVYWTATSFEMALLMAFTWSTIDMYLLRPYLLFKKRIVEKERNVFLLQFEHDQVCCDRPCDYRASRGWTGIEYCLLTAMVCRLVSAWVILTGLDISIIMLFSIMLAGWFIWTERKIHYYRDFAYTLMAVVFPDLILFFARYMYNSIRQLGEQNSAGLQIVLFIVYEVFMLIAIKVFSSTLRKVASVKEQAMMMLYPVQFYHSLFKYFCLYSIADISRASFTVAFITSLVFNIFDVSGLFSDIFVSIKQNYIESQSLTSAFQTKKIVSRIKSSFRLDYADETATFHSLAHSVASAPVQQEPSRNYSELLNTDEVVTLITMHQKASCLWIASWLGPSMVWLDSVTLNILRQENPRECIFLCIDGGIYKYSRVAIISAMFFGVSLMSYLVWKFRMSVYLRKRLSQPAFTAASPMKHKTALTADDHDKQEWERLMDGHISRQYERPINIIFMICCSIHGFWMIIGDF